MTHRDTCDFEFFQWAGVGFLLAFGTVAILSIGAPFVLLGVVLLGIMLGREPRWPASLGALAGAGVVGVVVGLIGAVAGSTLWAAYGVALLVPASTAFWWLRCRPTP